MMKKNYFYALVILTVICLGIVNVFAAETSYMNGPNITPETTYVGAIRSFTSGSTTATGNNTYVLFNNFGALNVNLVSWSNRTLTVRLYEYDVSNSNDLVKYYVWSFSGRTLDEVTLTKKITGNIESSGDATAELFLEFDLTKNSEDTGSSGSFFKYKYGIN